MINTVKKEFKKCNIRFDQKILIAVSGGVDSMVLWNLLHQTKHLYGVAHVNFDLRGEESDADEALIQRIAMERKVPFHTKRVDTKQYAEDHGISIQMAARDLRYAFFNELARHYKYDSLATGHHLEDDFETFLLNVNRGTGVKGLAGIRSTAKKFRPLLSFTKEEIREYANENKIEFREDKTNDSKNYTRNWFRHEIIGPWKEKNPSLLKTMRQNLNHLKETYDVLNDFVINESQGLTKELDQGFIKYSTLNSINRKQFYLYHVLAPLGFTSVQVNNMLGCIKKKAVGKTFLGKHCSIALEREKLEIITGEELQTEHLVHLIEKNTTVISEPIHMELQRLLIDEFKNSQKSKRTEIVDRSKLVFPLQIRKWKAGDKMQPLGMQGKKKISDILTDLKVSRAQKETTYVLLSEGNVVWLIGHRLDDRYKVTDESKKLLQMTV